jgi:carbon-monoxide dehydrogenase small subunit
MADSINFILNDEQVSINADPLRRLLDVLREEFGFTGVKEGCGQGECGACSVIIDGRLANSCIVPVGTVEGKKVLTIEGLKKTKRFDVLQECFQEAGAVQCGFCTPGMIMASEALLSKNNNPSEDEIRVGLSGNLCRCTGYGMIVDAVKMAAKRGEGLW